VGREERRQKLLKKKTADVSAAGASTGHVEPNGCWPFKDLGNLDPDELRDLMEVDSYRRGHLWIERLLLRQAGIGKRTAQRLVRTWRDARERWHEALDADNSPRIGGWGAASDEALTAFKSVEAVVSIINYLGQFLVEGVNTITGQPRNCGIVHGSSVTGFMGVWDRSWASAIKLCRKIFIPIINIPLNWVVKDIREIPAKSGKREFRCPPHLFLTHRTEAFARAKPKLIIVAPGGLGTRFEVYWALLSAQLRKLLLTAFTGWKHIPEIVLLDYWMDLDEEPGEVPDKPEVKVARARAREIAKQTGMTSDWHYEGIRRDMVSAILGDAMSQRHIDHVTIVRVGKGDDIVGDERIGPSVRYFPQASDAAQWIATRLDQAIVDSSEQEKAA